LYRNGKAIIRVEKENEGLVEKESEGLQVTILNNKSAITK
jgi:hypothetical protein